MWDGRRAAMSRRVADRRSVPTVIAPLLIAGGLDGDGVNLPGDPGSAIVWVVFLAVLVALYMALRRTRQRAERDWEERRRRLEDPGTDDEAP
jgi:hypothetical protein